VTFRPSAGEALPILAIAFVVAAVISLLLTPWVRGRALRHGVVDRPNARRVNLQPVPRGGGVAVVLAFLAVATVLVVVNERLGMVRTPVALDTGQMVALLGGGAAAAALGAVDDYLDLRARWQLVGQVAANLRRLRKPDPYQQKGVRFTGEVLKKKAGKTGA